MKTLKISLICSLLLFIAALQVTNAQKKIAAQESGNSTLSVKHLSIDNFTVIDTAKYTVTYSVQAMINPKYPKDIVKEVMTLQIGNKISKIYNQTLYENDSIDCWYIKKGIVDHAGGGGKSPVFPVDIYKNYPKGSTTVTYRLFRSKSVYRYKETYPLNFNWQLSNEQKRILSYSCQKATCTFRGRNYTAWFAPEIPIKEGPYKFGGLPGLILQMNDDSCQYTFTCIGIQKAKPNTPIKFWKWQYEDIARDKLNSSLTKVFNNQGRFLIASGVHAYVLEGNEKIETDLSKVENFYSYNPIELK
jgi:GLPGLI family protein